MTHYSRWRRTGNPGDATIALKGLRHECEVDGCYRTATALKMCGMHHLRIYRNGTLAVRPRSGPGHVKWRTRDNLTYDAAHDRVQRQYGPASTHKCIDCTAPANDWAYQHQAADPLHDDLGRPYSDDTADYAPMCRPCHKAFDIEQSRQAQGGDRLSIVTIDEAAEYAGVTVATVRSWAKRGLLAPIKTGTRPLLYRYDDVAHAQFQARSEAWRKRHADAVAEWLACA